MLSIIGIFSGPFTGLWVRIERPCPTDLPPTEGGGGLLTLYSAPHTPAPVISFTPTSRSFHWSPSASPQLADTNNSRPIRSPRRRQTIRISVVFRVHGAIRELVADRRVVNYRDRAVRFMARESWVYTAPFENATDVKNETN